MPLNSLRLKNFTVFSELDITFSPGLNVIIGENATGKSHLLKLGYALAHVLFCFSRNCPIPTEAKHQHSTKAEVLEGSLHGT